MLAYKFRLYPNKEEDRKLLWTLEVCRKVYNRFPGPYCGGESTIGSSCKLYCWSGRYGRNDRNSRLWTGDRYSRQRTDCKPSE
jgi:hypothetical protein